MRTSENSDKGGGFKKMGENLRTSFTNDPLVTEESSCLFNCEHNSLEDCTGPGVYITTNIKLEIALSLHGPLHILVWWKDIQRRHIPSRHLFTYKWKLPCGIGFIIFMAAGRARRARNFEMLKRWPFHKKITLAFSKQSTLSRFCDIASSCATHNFDVCDVSLLNFDLAIVHF